MQCGLKYFGTRFCPLKIKITHLFFLMDSVLIISPLPRTLFFIDNNCIYILGKSSRFSQCYNVADYEEYARGFKPIQYVDKVDR